MNSELINSFIKNGYNCSQTILCYFAENFGLKEDIAKKISSPFESGAFKAELCGACSGSYMVLGLKFNLADNNREVIEEKIKEFDQKFKEQLTSLYCKDLLAYDISRKDGMKKAVEENLFEKVCPNCIRIAIGILEEMLV